MSPKLILAVTALWIVFLVSLWNTIKLFPFGSVVINALQYDLYTDFDVKFFRSMHYVAHVCGQQKWERYSQTRTRYLSFCSTSEAFLGLAVFSFLSKCLALLHLDLVLTCSTTDNFYFVVGHKNNGCTHPKYFRSTLIHTLSQNLN